MEGTAQGQREKEARRNSQLLDEAYNDLIDANVQIGNLQRTLASLEREVRTLREMELLARALDVAREMPAEREAGGRT